MLSCLETLVGHVIFLKGLIAAAFESSEPLYLLSINGRVSAIHTQRVYRHSDTHVLAYAVAFILSVQGLTQVEEMLISAVMPIMSLYKLPHGQYDYSV